MRTIPTLIIAGLACALLAGCQTPEDRAMDQMEQQMRTQMIMMERIEKDMAEMQKRMEAMDKHMSEAAK